eukprot:g3398.t1
MARRFFVKAHNVLLVLTFISPIYVARYWFADHLQLNCGATDELDLEELEKTSLYILIFCSIICVCCITAPYTFSSFFSGQGFHRAWWRHVLALHLCAILSPLAYVFGARQTRAACAFADIQYQTKESCGALVDDSGSNCWKTQKTHDQMRYDLELSAFGLQSTTTTLSMMMGVWMGLGPSGANIVNNVVALMFMFPLYRLDTSDESAQKIVNYSTKIILVQVFLAFPLFTRFLLVPMRNGAKEEFAEYSRVASSFVKLRQPRILPRLLEVGKKLGAGGSGQIFEGRYSGQKVAVKELFSGILNPGDLEEIEKEAETLSRLRHPHIAAFFGVCAIDKRNWTNFDDKSRVVLVLELCQIDLHRMLKIVSEFRTRTRVDEMVARHNSNVATESKSISGVPKDEEKEVRLEVKSERKRKLSLIHVFSNEDNAIKAEEYAKLEKVLDKWFTPTTCIIILSQVAQAMAYIHANDLFHLDLKPENIMLSKLPTSTTLAGDVSIRICDFGTARQLGTDDNRDSLDNIESNEEMSGIEEEDDFTGEDGNIKVRRLDLRSKFLVKKGEKKDFSSSCTYLKTTPKYSPPEAFLENSGDFFISLLEEENMNDENIDDTIFSNISSRLIASSSRGLGRQYDNIHSRRIKQRKKREAMRLQYASWDVYSFGMLVCELALYREPFSGLSIQSVTAMKLKKEKPSFSTDDLEKAGFLNDGVNRKLTNVVNSCLHENPLERPSFEDLCKMLKVIVRKVGGRTNSLTSRIAVDV